MPYRQLAALVLVCLATSGSAQELTNLGLLTCTLGERPGRSVSCGFKPTASGAEEKYVGTIRTRDDAAPAGKLVMIWAVMGPAKNKMSPGILAQSYAKEAGSSGLVGETNSSIVLQFETSNGTEASDAITHVELKLTTTPA